MGTSASFRTPSGGDWTAAKNAVTDAVGAGSSASAATIVARTLRALGGVDGSTTSRGTTGAGGGGTRGGTGGGGGGAGGGRARTAARAVAGVGSFGAGVRDAGLANALDAIGLSALRDKPAAEVISCVAERIAESGDGLLYDVLYGAFVQAIYDAAELMPDASFDDLESALQTYLSANGPEGLASLFLSHYLFSRVWTSIEKHVTGRADSNGEHEALLRTVHEWCRDQVAAVFEDARIAGRIERVNWFGDEGRQLAERIVRDFETRLATAEAEAAT